MKQGIKVRIDIRLDKEQYAKLDFLSQKYEFSIAALIRWCVSDSLPRLQALLERNSTKEN